MPAAALTPAGVSSAISSPSRMSSSRSQRLASSMTWLETSTVVPAAASRGTGAHSSSRSTGSCPTVGSSSTSTSGLPTSAQASEARLRWPPDSVATSWSAASARPTSPQRLVGVGLAAARTGEAK